MSPGGHMPKGRGTAYEYRVKQSFIDWGWEAYRNPLSGASEQIAETTGKHDVRASKDGIFLQIECKKTAEEFTHKLKRIWIEKLDFNNDEFLVFAFGRSPHYALVSEIYFKTLSPDFVAAPRYVATGSTQFTFHRSWFNDEDLVCFLWEDYGEVFIAISLDKLIDLIIKRGALKALHPMDFINSSQNVQDLVDWYKGNHHRLTNKEKSHYYAKLHRLENNLPDVDPLIKADSQWWRDTGDDVILKCPHCDKLITHGDIKKAKEINDKN